MRNTKKLAGLLLALAMLLTLPVNVFAAGEGSITIDNAVVDQTYTIYRILDLESYDAQSGAYAYKANAVWKAFAESTDIKDVYLAINELGYVTWVKGADAAAFAKLAQKYAADNSIANQGVKKADSTTVKFEGLDLGYYLVDSTLGTLCALNTTNPDVTMKEKNDAPTNEKKVEEDSNRQFGDKNDADIGQTVNFRSTVTAQAGAQNYIFHDQMSAGLTFDGADSVKVTQNGTAVNMANYTVKTTELGDGCTFHVVFTQAFCDALKANDSIVISYTATVNSQAVIGGNSNDNESKLTYGENGQFTTAPDQTKTYTWKFGVFKYELKDGNETARPDAKFVLYKNEEGKKLYAQADENDKITGWTDDKTKATGFISPADGKFTISGLDSDTYYLEEIEAPAGYNVLKEPVVVTINNEGKVNVSEENPHGIDEVKVLNQTGAELPSTGGAGTTVFYAVGSALVLAAVVLLVTRKRMSAKN